MAKYGIPQTVLDEITARDVNHEDQTRAAHDPREHAENGVRARRDNATSVG